VLECLEELGWIRPEALRAARTYRDHGFLAGRGRGPLLEPLALPAAVRTARA